MAEKMQGSNVPLESCQWENVTMDGNFAGQCSQDNVHQSELHFTQKEIGPKQFYERTKVLLGTEKIRDTGQL